MTLREAAALLLLFKSCADPAVRERAVRLVPELRELDDNTERARRRAVHDSAHGTYFPGKCQECLDEGWDDLA